MSLTTIFKKKIVVNSLLQFCEYNLASIPEMLIKHSTHVPKNPVLFKYIRIKKQ